MTTNTATADTAPVRNSKAMLWAGYALSGLFVAFMIFDSAIKLIRLPVVGESLVALGYPPSIGFGIGVVEAVALVLYVIPRTSILGAVLMTGVMGGAMASHLRIGNPWPSHILFGVYLGLLAWGGLWLRNPALRALFPLRTR
ncbi:MAG: Arginine/ornithine antiporter ArcD [Phenylobacterium sp.]|jgi:hypothetical protein|nr:Arginine/ornithine antiporter ArcD [Phenylobacterium sp.]